MFPRMEQGMTAMNAFEGFELFTHVVEWDQWSHDGSGWGFDTKYEYFKSESEAINFCNQLRLNSRKYNNISWRKVGSPRFH